MKLSKTLLLILSCALAAASGAAARRPKLTGKWVLDAGRSSFGNYDGPMSKAGTKLDIKHKEPEVRIVWDYELGQQRLSQLTIFFSDGRGQYVTSQLNADWLLSESLPGSRGGGGPGRQVRSQTAWEGDKLVTRTADRLRVPVASVSGPAPPPAYVPVEVIDEWELSRDGKSLTQTTRVVSADAPAREVLREFRRVYSRSK